MPYLMVMVVLAAQSSKSTSVPNGEQVAPAEVVERLSDNLRAIHSLRLKWHVETPGGKGQPAANIWAYQGSQFVDSGMMGHHAPTPYWRSFDGEFGYSVNYWLGDAKQVNEIIRSRRAHPGGLDFGLRPIGLKLAGTDQTLLQLLDEQPPQYMGVEEVEGAPTHLLVFGTLEHVWKVPHDLKVWVDAEAMMPRRIRIRPSSISPGKPHLLDPGKGEVYEEVVIGGYEKVADANTAELRYFPSRLTSPAQTTVFDEIQLNPALPKSTFIPEMQVGATFKTEQLVKVPGTGQLQPSKTVVGGKAGEAVVAKRVERLRQSQNQPAAPSVAAPSASPRMPITAVFWQQSTWLICASIIVIGASVRWFLAKSPR